MTIRRRALSALFLLLFATAAHADDPRAYLEQLRRSTGTPGISAAVAQKGRIVFSDGVGYADLDNLVPANGATVFNVGSVSKVITAVAVLQLVEQGKVDLDDPIQKYVPAFPQKAAGVVTVRHLMTQTSGIRHYRRTDFPESAVNENVKPFASFEESLRIFKDDPLLFKPGEFYSYSSYAVNLLQGVIESASGMKFEEYLRQHVWSPAGMSSTQFDVPERIVPHRAKGYEVAKGTTTNFPYGDVTYKFASGGMLSSADDLVRFGMALSRLLKPETIKAMYTPVPGLLQFPSNKPVEFSQGLMWRIFTDEAGRRFVNHCGTVKGFNACVVIYPDHGVVAALLGNGDPVTPARKATVALAQMFLPSVPPHVGLIDHHHAPVLEPDLVLHDVARCVALPNLAAAARGVDDLTLSKGEGRRGVVERLQPMPPMDLERADAVDLHDRAVRTVAEHRAPLRRERVVAGAQRRQRGAVPFVGDGEVPRALDHGDVLVDRMRVQRDLRPGKLVDPHHERLARLVGIAGEDLGVARHRVQAHDVRLAGGAGPRDARGRGEGGVRLAGLFAGARRGEEADDDEEPFHGSVYSKSYECFPSSMTITIVPLKPASSLVPESGTTVMLSDGTPRFIVALCCRTNVPLRPASVPLTRSMAT
jgi:serine beta-lactamase-like protein LACTB, mitochondrial